MFNVCRSKIVFFLPLLLYAGITYCAALWFLFPFFLASCFYALCWLSSSSQISLKQLRRAYFLPSKLISLFVWSFFAALILIFPCAIVLLEFYSLGATIGLIFLVTYTTFVIALLVILLVFLGNIIVEPILQLLSWSSVFIAWWWFIDSFFFIGVGVPCGYVIANPVLCCAVSPNCSVIQLVGMYGLLTCYVLAVGGMVLWWVCLSRISACIALVALGILVGASIFEKVFIAKSNLMVAKPWEHIVAFKCEGLKVGVLEDTLVLQRQFLACCERPVVPDLIVGPESCLSCALNNEPSLCTLFDNLGMCLSPHVLLGARRQEEKVGIQECVVSTVKVNKHTTLGKNSKYFNTAFMLHQGRITYHYDKLFPLPFLETCSTLYFLPFLYGLFSLKKIKIPSTTNQHGLFFSKVKVPYTPGSRREELDITLGGTTYQARLALCSDFFCTKIFDIKKNSRQNNPLLIVLTHDSWFYGTSVADRMHRYAVLWSVRHQIPILYVGNLHTSWIERSGRVLTLSTVDS